MKPNFASSIYGLTDDAIRAVAPAVFAEEAHESRSSKYVFYSTAVALGALRNEGYVPTYVIQSRTRDEGRTGFARTMLRLRHVDNLGPKNADVHEVIFVNSADGGSAYMLQNGYHRLVCLNGMTAWENIDNFKIYHKGAIVDNIVESTLELAKDAGNIMNRLEEMKHIDLTLREQEVFARYALKARYGEREDGSPDTLFQPTDLLRARRSIDSGNTLYLTQNKVQENAMKGGVRRLDERGQRHTSRPLTSVGGTLSVNKLIWQMSQELRAYKFGEESTVGQLVEAG